MDNAPCKVRVTGDKSLVWTEIDKDHVHDDICIVYVGGTDWKHTRYIHDGYTGRTCYLNVEHDIDGRKARVFVRVRKDLELYTVYYSMDRRYAILVLLTKKANEAC